MSLLDGQSYVFRKAFYIDPEVPGCSRLATPSLCLISGAAAKNFILKVEPESHQFGPHCNRAHVAKVVHAVEPHPRCPHVYRVFQGLK